jgi:hypothetical protein
VDQEEMSRPAPERDAMTTVGTVIGHLLAVGATIRGERSTVASTLICRNGIEASIATSPRRQLTCPDAASRN